MFVAMIVEKKLDCALGDVEGWYHGCRVGCTDGCESVDSWEFKLDDWPAADKVVTMVEHLAVGSIDVKVAGLVRMGT